MDIFLSVPQKYLVERSPAILEATCNDYAEIVCFCIVRFIVISTEEQIKGVWIGSIGRKNGAHTAEVSNVLISPQ